MRGVEFTPGREGGSDGKYNLWKGFNIKKDAIPKPWTKIKHHLEVLICNNNPELIEYLYNWIARSFQKPAEPAGSLESRPGTSA